MAKTRKSTKGIEEKIVKENIQKRFKSMFSGNAQPLSNLSIQEVETLKARITQLEAELADQPPFLGSSNFLKETSRVFPLANAKSPQKRRGLHLSVSIKSILTIALVFILAAILQYQFNFSLAKQEIEKAARQHSEANYESYVSRVIVEQNAAEAMAASIAQRADVRELYQAGNRQALYELLLPMFNELKENNRIVHLYLEDTNGRVFLRVHDPEHFGDDITYRGTAADALKEKRVTSGIEIGANRIGVRGVAPMYAGSSLIGLIEVGFDFDEQFVNDLKDLHGADYSMWITYDASAPAGMKPKENLFKSPLETMFYYTGTISSQWNIAPEVYEKVLATGEPTFEIITENTDSPSIVYIVPLRGYKNKIIGIFEIADSYRNTINALKNTQIRILQVVGALTLLGLILIAFFYRRLVLRPLGALADFAKYQLNGDTSRRIFINSNDEFEQLATSFNNLADSVEERQLTLEQRVVERTHDLELASEVGRTVSERVNNLSEMLIEAVTMIRTRFNLYYTQIYLVDAFGKNITLQAGTGEVGKELLQRGHHLPIDSGSLNGRAASEKRAMIVADTKDNPSFLPNPLLPNTRSEMAVPLIVAGKVVGVLDMQSEQPGALNEANQPAFEALAGQLAIAVENAALFARAEEARAEVEAQVRRLTEQGWQDFLDAIDHGQKIGFTFYQSQIIRLKPDALAAKSEDRDLSIPITITGTKVGEIQLPVEKDRTWTTNDIEFISATSAQLAQHIDNLRLLAQADRYRAQAEQAARRLTREGWDSYLQTYSETELGYLFDLTEVKPLSDSTNVISDHSLRYPVIVRDETIGEIAVDMPDHSDEADQILEAVTEQLRSHLENLRLTEQTQSALAATQESESKLSEALNIAKLAHWEYDVERDIFTFNDHFYSIFHTTAEEVGGYELSSAQYVQFFVLPEDAPVVGKEIAKALTSTERHFYARLEHRIRFPDGSPGYISVEVHVERDENGKIIRWYGANQDITERKRAEEAILAEQRRTQTILESVTVPMVITRLSDNHLTFINSPALEVTQFNYENVINQPAPDFYAQLDDRKEFITELRAKGEVSDMVVQLRRASGETFWALLSAKIFDYQAEASILTTFMDITDRIRAQEAVAKRATELATVAQVSTTASTVLDPDQLLQSVVDLTKERFGLYHAHIYLTDESWQTLLLAAGAGEVGRKLVAEEHAIPMSIEHSLVTRAARERKPVIVNDVKNEPGFLPNPLLPKTCAEMAVPMIVGEKVLGVFDVQSNNTDGFSEADANIYVTLAAQVGVALQNARLYKEQAATLTQLRELDKLKSSFLANMSHELRTPLNSILGFADVMLEGLDGELTEYMDNDLRLIQKNGQHLLHLINDVLDMAKIESGRMNLNPEIFKVHDVLEEVTSITSTMASEKSLSLFIDEQSDPEIQIYADNTRLRQVMINLVNNAIKFTDKGRIILSTKATEGARILITVQDTGIGIPPDKLEAIFQEFTQVDSSATRKVGGTGLGLPISRRLVEMHGGRLWAESTGTSDQGSTFFVELPVEARITEVIEKQEKNVNA